MTDYPKPHPLQQAIRVWAADPETWVFVHKNDNRPQFFPPPVLAASSYQCVPRAWLDDPESVEVWARRRDSLQNFARDCLLQWDHERDEYRIIPKPRKEYAAVCVTPSTIFTAFLRQYKEYQEDENCIGWIVREGGKWGFESNE